MKMQILCIFLLYAAGSLAHSTHPEILEISSEKGRKMIFTDYIKSNDTEKAQKDSLVSSELFPNITSYAGFFTVNETCDSNLFFWFFPSQNDPSKDPVSIWLNGGPGGNSIRGVFSPGLGPYGNSSDGSWKLENYTWTRNSSMIFIDSPIGTGYSYGNRSCYATEMTQVGRDILNALKQFFLVFPEYKTNDFYVTGVSYAGHYVPAVGLTIHNDTDTGINLKGIAIGNGWVDPENQLVYSENLFQLGLIDAKTRDQFKIQEKAAKEAIHNGQFHNASQIWLDLLKLSVKNFGFDIYNFLKDGHLVEDPMEDRNDPFFKFINSTAVRKAIHVGSAEWHGEVASDVRDKLHDDMSRSYRPWLETLMDHYKVLIYNGQLDVIVSYASTANYLPLLDWKGKKEYASAQRQIWRSDYDGKIAGYVKTAGNFTDVLVRNASHSVCPEQPAWALELYNKFIFNQPIGNS